MPVTSSSYTVGNALPDGRVQVYETHSTPKGPYTASYLAEVTDDKDAILAARVAGINETLKAWEFSEVIMSAPAVLNLVEQTGAQLAARFWERAKEAFKTDKFAYGRLMWWLYEMVSAGYLTSAQVRTSYNTAFGKSLDTTAWNSLVTSRIVPAHDRYAAILAESEI